MRPDRLGLSHGIRSLSPLLSLPYCLLCLLLIEVVDVRRPAIGGRLRFRLGLWGFLSLAGSSGWSDRTGGTQCATCSTTCIGSVLFSLFRPPNSPWLLPLRHLLWGQLVLRRPSFGRLLSPSAWPSENRRRPEYSTVSEYLSNIFRRISESLFISHKRGGSRANLLLHLHFG
jgi:hypothetical protein